MDPFKWFANLLVYDWLNLTTESAIGHSLQFFVEDTTKIFVLLAIMIYVIALIRAGLPIDKIRNFLVGKNRFIGYVLASILGAITPFCSCSSIPIFVGFCAARIPVGITMAFLITSPMINEVAIAMLGDILGLELTIIYIAFGMLAGILGGIFFDLIKAQKWIVDINNGNNLVDSKTENTQKITWQERHTFAKEELKDLLKSIWIWVIVGISIGAFLHGFVPDNLIESYLGGGQWWSVPLATLVGIPTYANATGVIPIIGALIEKGLPVGTAFAFMLSTVAASIPEFIMLKKVMSTKLLIIFAIYLLIFFTLCGWVLNIIYL